MVIISWNVNGLTACMGKNGFEPIMALQPDIVCLQEVKTSRRPKVLLGYHHYWETGQREGYAGVLTMAKLEPLDVKMGLGNESLDREGRIITLEYQSFYLINAYCSNSREHRAFLARWGVFQIYILKHAPSLYFCKSKNGYALLTAANLYSKLALFIFA